ncbi:MAG: sugar phosphate isomerase/epimerase [Candidatus Latescibacteria bacterium]|nr:sugar phosphate isomerase/epimerase [Candidatus Latescibacterota bacterium]
MAPPIAVQLYTVRDLLPGDFAGTVTRIAQIGYAGVETGGFQGVSTQEAARLFAGLGLKVPSVHAALPLGDQERPTVELAQALGVRRVVASTSRDAFASVEQVRKLCDTWNQAQQVAQRHNLELHLHNHWWEFRPVGDRNGLDLLLEYLDPKIGIQMDTYWAQTGGYDPAAAVKRWGRGRPCCTSRTAPATNQGRRWWRWGRARWFFTR